MLGLDDKLEQAPPSEAASPSVPTTDLHQCPGQPPHRDPAATEVRRTLLEENRPCTTLTVIGAPKNKYSGWLCWTWVLKPPSSQGALMLQRDPPKEGTRLGGY